MTDPVALFPDATAVVCTILDATSKVPDPRPDVFTTVRRTGGPRRDQVTDNAQITVESWALTESAAHDLAQLNRQALHEARGAVVSGVTVYTVTEASGPAVLPDPLSNQPRYSQTFTVAVRGS